MTLPKNNIEASVPTLTSPVGLKDMKKENILGLSQASPNITDVITQKR
jgi:hypothetical protein